MKAAHAEEGLRHLLKGQRWHLPQASLQSPASECPLPVPNATSWKGPGWWLRPKACPALLAAVMSGPQTLEEEEQCPPH